MSQSLEHTPTPERGKYDFDGECAPHRNPKHHYDTFTLGIFEWEPKRSFTGRPGALLPSQLKRGKVLVRVKGLTANPGPAYEEARDRCRILNIKPENAPTP